MNYTDSLLLAAGETLHYAQAGVGPWAAGSRATYCIVCPTKESNKI